MKKDILISIITVCYNSSKTIEKTFQSVQKQTYKNIEYIVIDGNSTDNTLAIIAKYNNIITKNISERDKGLYDAMNKGIALAKGDLVGVLNSDDVFHDDKVLENIIKFHKNNYYEAYIGDVVQFNDRGKIVRRYSGRNWNPEKLKIGFMPPHPSLFVSRELFEKYGYYQLDFVSCADYELIIRFFLKNKVSWKYSNITTTAMLIGGISTSGIVSYKLISREICKALWKNNIKFSPAKIYFRFCWKILGIINRRKT
jgi:glycosyltransferase involved in cell wall biosynthesis